MRRGWYGNQPPRSPSGGIAAPASQARAIFGSCVVLPEPVSPQTMMTWCSGHGGHDFIAARGDGKGLGLLICKA